MAIDERRMRATVTGLSFVVVSGVLMGMGACAHDTSATSPPTAVDAPAPLMPDGPTLALQRVDAPGMAIDDLTARVRDGLVYGSGVVVVDEMSVRAELAACVEMPCAEVQQERFKTSTLTANASLAKVGTAILGTLRITRGLKEVARVSAQGADVQDVATRLGREGGAALRAAILRTTTVTTTAPDTAER